MFKNTYLVICTACLIQIISCGRIDDLMKELKPTVQSAVIKASTVVSNGSSIIRQTYASIEEYYAVLDHSIFEREKQLDTVVKKTAHDARKSGKDISACVRQEKSAVRALTRTDFELCRFSRKLNRLTYKLADVAKLEVILTGMPAKCVIHSHGKVTKTRACVLRETTDVTRRADSVAAEIAVAATKAKKIARECAKYQAEILLNYLVKIANDFDLCVKNN